MTKRGKFEPEAELRSSVVVMDYTIDHHPPPPFRVLSPGGGPPYALQPTAMVRSPPPPPSSRAPEPYKLTNTAQARSQRKSAFAIIAEAPGPTPAVLRASSSSPQSSSRPSSPSQQFPGSDRLSPFRGRGFKGPPPRSRSQHLSRPHSPSDDLGDDETGRSRYNHRRVSISQQSSPKRSQIPRPARSRSISSSKENLSRKASPKFGRRAAPKVDSNKRYTSSVGNNHVNNRRTSLKDTKKRSDLSPIQGTPTKVLTDRNNKVVARKVGQVKSLAGQKQGQKGDRANHKKPPMLGGKRFITADSSESSPPVQERTTTATTSDSPDSPSKIPMRRQGQLLNNSNSASSSSLARLSSPAKTTTTATPTPRASKNNPAANQAPPVATPRSSSSDKPTTDDATPSSKVRVKKAPVRKKTVSNSTNSTDNDVPSQNLNSKKKLPPPPRIVKKGNAADTGKRKKTITNKSLSVDSKVDDDLDENSNENSSSSRNSNRAKSKPTISIGKSRKVLNSKNSKNSGSVQSSIDERSPSRTPVHKKITNNSKSGSNTGSVDSPKSKPTISIGKSKKVLNSKNSGSVQSSIDERSPSRTPVHKKIPNNPKSSVNTGSVDSPKIAARSKNVNPWQTVRTRVQKNQSLEKNDKPWDKVRKNVHKNNKQAKKPKDTGSLLTYNPYPIPDFVEIKSNNVNKKPASMRQDTASSNHTQGEDEPGLVDLMKQSSGVMGTSSVVNTTTTTAVQPLHIDASSILAESELVAKLTTLEKKQKSGEKSPDSQKSSATNPRSNAKSKSPRSDDVNSNASSNVDQAKNSDKSEVDKASKDTDDRKMNSGHKKTDSKSSSIAKNSTKSTNSGPDSKKASPRIDSAEAAQARTNSSESLGSIRSTDTGVSVNTVRGVSSAKEKSGLVVKRSDEIETLSGNIVNHDRNGADQALSGDLGIEGGGKPATKWQKIKNDFRKRLNRVGVQRGERLGRACCCLCCPGMRCLACKAKGPKGQMWPGSKAARTTSTTQLTDKAPSKWDKFKDNTCRCSKLRSWLHARKSKRQQVRQARAAAAAAAADHEESVSRGCCSGAGARLGALCRSLKSKCSCGGCGWPCRRKSQARIGKNARSKPSLTSVQAPPVSEENRPKLPDVLVEHNSIMRGAIPCLPVPVAWLCLICNLFFPGSGTALSGVFNLCCGQPRFSATASPKARVGALVVNIIVGVSQLFTILFCFVGWGWSIWWGVTMLRLARKYKRFKESEAASNDPEARGPGLETATLPAPGVPPLRAGGPSPGGAK